MCVCVCVVNFQINNNDKCVIFLVIPHPHYPDVGARFYESARLAIPTATEPPPAHRNTISATPPINYAPPSELPTHLLPKALEREREQREKERKSSIPGMHSI